MQRDKRKEKDMKQDLTAPYLITSLILITINKMQKLTNINFFYETIFC